VAEDTATLFAGLAISMATNWKLALIVSSFLPVVLLEGFAEMNLVSATFKAAKVKPPSPSKWLPMSVDQISNGIFSLCSRFAMLVLRYKY